MVTVFLPIRRKRNRGSWKCKPAEGAKRLRRYEERKKERKGGEEEEVVGWVMGGEEEEEGRVSLATFRFALI